MAASIEGELCLASALVQNLWTDQPVTAIEMKLRFSESLWSTEYHMKIIVKWNEWNPAYFYIELFDLLIVMTISFNLEIGITLSVYILNKHKYNLGKRNISQLFLSLTFLVW